MDAQPLERSGDRKVSFALRPASGGKYVSAVANSHGLPAGISCPGRTSVCAGPSAALSTTRLEQIANEGELAAGGRGRETTWRYLLPRAGISPDFPCYVVADLRRGTEENAAYRNWRALRGHLTDTEHLTAVIGATLDAFLADCTAEGVAPQYRFHWDGDIATVQMAAAIAAALQARPAVHAWLYTRSLFAVPLLARVENLTTYVSVDAGNIDAAAPVLAAHPRVRAAVLGRDGADTAELLRILGRAAAPVCPVDTGKLPVVTATNAAREPVSGEPAVGACALCRLCVTGRSDVRFTLKKKPFRPPNQPGATLFDADDGHRHLFGDRPPAGLFDTLVTRLAAQLGDLEFTWRRTYVTVAADGIVLFRAQARGTRLLIVYPDPPPAGTGHDRLRDISGIRHQCPGRAELTLTELGHVAEAVTLAHPAARRAA